jgi:hypothetical protein
MLFVADASRSLEIAISKNPVQEASGIMHPGRNRRQRNYQDAGDKLRMGSSRLASSGRTSWRV